MTRGAGLGTALLAALADPATWLLGLLAFLLRGGVVVVLAPIVVLPSAVGLGNLLGPALTDLALGDTTRGLLILGSASVAILLAWLVVAWGLASVAEAESIRRIAADEDLVAAVGPPRPTRRGAAGRILIARVVVLLPVILAIGVGGVHIVIVTYRELTLPSDTAVPIAFRVVGGATGAVVGIVVTWFVAELVGALAARRIVLGDAGVLGALGGAIVDALRQPVRVLVGSLVPTAALVVVLAALVAAAGPIWGAVRSGTGRRPSGPARAADRGPGRRPVAGGSGPHRARLRVAGCGLDGPGGPDVRGGHFDPTGGVGSRADLWHAGRPSATGCRIGSRCVMTERAVECGACGAPVPLGRLSCPACGELLASVSGGFRASVWSNGRSQPSVLHDVADDGADATDGLMAIAVDLPTEPAPTLFDLEPEPEPEPVLDRRGGVRG